MKPRNIRMTMGIVLTGIILSLPLEHDGFAQNFSGLNGQELQARRDSEADLGVLLGGLFDKNNKISGTFGKVVVRKDSERQLVLSVSSSQLDQKVLWGELQGSDGKRQTQILTTSVVVPNGSAPIELTFNLDERLSKETKLESAVLYLYAARSSGAPAGLVRSYSIAKKWQMEIRPENMVTIIAPQPIDEAASLTERPVMTAVPSRSLSPHMIMKDRVFVGPRLMLQGQPK